MNAEDFQNLYMLLRGSKSAFAVLDARTLFIERKLTQALERVSEARENYAQSRSRLMKQPAAKQVDAKAADAARQIKRIQRKQDKVTEILKLFDEIVPKLTKLAERENSKQNDTEEKAAENNDSPLTAAADPPGTTAEQKDATADHQDASDSESSIEQGLYERPARPDDLTELFIKRFNQIDGDEQLAWVGKHFGFRPVDSAEEIYPDSLYFIMIRDETFLVQTRDASELVDAVALKSATNKVPMKSYSHDAFVRMGVRHRMVLLTIDFQHAEPLAEGES